MPWWGRLVIACIGIGFTIIGGIVGGFEFLDMRMDRKVNQGEERVLAIVKNYKTEADAKIVSAVTEADLKLKIVDTKMFTELTGLKSMVGSIDRNVNLLISIQRSAEIKKHGSYVTKK